MRTSFKLSVVAASLLALTACDHEKKEEAPVKLETEVQKQAYAIGSSMGGYVKGQLETHKELGVPLDSELVLRGLADALADKAAMTDEEARATLTSLETLVRAKKEVKAKADSEANIAAGKAFLEENAKREGVVTTDSGLQYEVLTAGEGNKPAETDTVKVHYHGTLIGGDVFDSSVDRGEPAVFPLNRVIKGWTEGVQYMQEGAKYKFYIPSELAYGERAMGDKIGANSTLVFEVELLSIESAK